MSRNLIIAMALLVSVASAQKLPQTQHTGIWAPQNIKIDGLATEWSGFQAYNKATNVFYTLSNDDINLYLVIQATDPVIINKITTSGVTLSINKPGNETAVTFSAYDKENKPIFEIILNAPKGKGAAAQIDTFIQSHNRLLAERQKIIRIAHNEKEGDISIYNNEGIKVAGHIDANLAYTQELSIPIKYLGIQPGETFNYSLQLNGQIPKGAIVTHPRPDIISYTGTDGKEYMVGHTTPDDLTLAYATNFKASYTMAIK